MGFVSIQCMSVGMVSTAENQWEYTGKLFVCSEPMGGATHAHSYSRRNCTEEDLQWGIAKCGLC